MNTMLINLLDTAYNNHKLASLAYTNCEPGCLDCISIKSAFDSLRASEQKEFVQRHNFNDHHKIKIDEYLKKVKEEYERLDNNSRDHFGFDK